MPGTVRILSIDGGGIRGLIPALVLQRLEQRVGAPIAELFHLVCGTSTGGLLALGLTQPGPGGRPRLSGDAAVRIYEERGADIFDRPLWYGFSSMGGVTDAKYPQQPLEKVLEEELGDAWISEALTDIFVTAYDLEQRRPRFLKSWKARGERLRPGESKEGRDFLTRDAARATSAAPTYFEPAHVPSRDGTRHCLVDGGVFANNPAMCGLASARKLYPDVGRYLVVSLGTGELERPIRYDEARDWGLAGWARPVLSVILDGVADTVDYQLREQFSRGYFRFQCDLGAFGDGSRGPNDDMDDASPENLHKLRRKAQDMLKARQDDLTRLVSQLRKPRDDLPRTG